MSEIKCDYCGGENYSVLEEHGGKYYHSKCWRRVQEIELARQQMEQMQKPTPFIMSQQHYNALRSLGYKVDLETDSHK